MKTKDGRSAYGTRKCECDNPTMKGKRICERCYKLQSIFKDKNYCGEYSEESLKISERKLRACRETLAIARKSRWLNKNDNSTSSVLDDESKFYKYAEPVSIYE